MYAHPADSVCKKVLSKLDKAERELVRTPTSADLHVVTNDLFQEVIDSVHHLKSKTEGSPIDIASISWCNELIGNLAEFCMSLCQNDGNTEQRLLHIIESARKHQYTQRLHA